MSEKQIPQSCGNGAGWMDDCFSLFHLKIKYQIDLQSVCVRVEWSPSGSNT